MKSYQVIVCVGSLLAIGAVWALRDGTEATWSGWTPEQSLAPETEAQVALEFVSTDEVTLDPDAAAQPDNGPRVAAPAALGDQVLAIPTIDALMADAEGGAVAAPDAAAFAAEQLDGPTAEDRPGDRVRYDVLVVELDARADAATVEAALPAGAVARREPLAPVRSSAPRLANSDPQALQAWMACRESLERTWVYELHAPVDQPADVLTRLRDLPGVVTADFDMEAEGTAFNPQDPAYVNGKLYGHDKLRVEQAWQAYLGRKVVVAVIDSGLRRQHREFEGALWRNPGEVPGNGRDDDRNGYVDDVWGWDFVGNDRAPYDAVGHGSHVSGTIGARDNGKGMVGIAPRAKLMTVRILDGKNRTTASRGLRGFIYAIENGARLTNQSWGGSRSGWSSSIVNRYFNVYMAAWNAGALSVVSAGNNSRDRRLEMPAALPTVIAVAAVNAKGDRASFSNYNAHVAAPGVNVYSSDADGNASYRQASGTSMAAPHVTGTLALLLERNPDISAPNAVRRLFKTTWVVGSLKNYGAGIVDAAAATGQGSRMTAATPAKLKQVFAAR